MAKNKKSSPYVYIAKYYDNSHFAKRYFSCTESTNWRDRISHEQLKLVLANLNKELLCKNHPLALDIGCSSGRYTNALIQEGIKTIGIDTAINPLIFASQRINADFIRSSATNIPFKKDCFDMVICVELFHHFEDYLLEIVLEEISKILKPGGILIFDLKNKMNPLIFYKYRKYVDDEYTHKCRTNHDIRTYMDNYGFQIIKKKSVLFPFIMFAPYIMYFCIKDNQ
jgi:SAM-dependent methyltransferase